MRRLLALAVLLAVGGCGGGSNGATPSVGAASSPAAVRGSSSASVAPGDTGKPASPAAKNTAQVCAAAQQAATTGVNAYVLALAKLLQAQSDKNSSAEQAARKSATAALTAWRDAVTKQAAKATDSQVRGALTEVAAGVAALRKDVEHVDEAQFDALNSKLTSVCGS